MCLLAQELSLKERTDVLIIKAVEYVLNIKRKYVQRFGRESFDLKEMISALDIVEYNNFAKCVNIVQRDEFCLLSYSLIKGGDIDIFNKAILIIEFLFLSTSFINYDETDAFHQECAFT